MPIEISNYLVTPGKCRSGNQKHTEDEEDEKNKSENERNKHQIQRQVFLTLYNKQLKKEKKSFLIFYCFFQTEKDQYMFELIFFHYRRMISTENRY